MSVRGVKLTGPGGMGGVSASEGRILLKGGATMLFRMVNKTIRGPGGKPIKKVSRQTYYVCNEDNIEGSLRQTQLSFTDTRRTTNQQKRTQWVGTNFLCVFH